MKLLLHLRMNSLLVILAFFPSLISFAQEYTPTTENLQNREWFQDAKFGMFVHWGIYSVLGVQEWVMETQRIDKKTYEKVASFFNPTQFDAEAWVLLAKAAGMKYITITAKHHDGFAMYDSKISNWDIVDQSPYGKDVLKQLAKACKKHDIKLFFYYSQLDWYHNDYFPRGRTGHKAGRPNEGNWDNYIDYMNAQLTELLTNYGEIGGIWFDGWWDRKEANWRLKETYGLIHKLQPGTLIGSNHHQAPKPGEDFQMFEKDLPGENKGGHSKDAKVGSLPLETAETMAKRWGFSLQDKAYKSSKELIQYLVKAAGYNANFLLNVGPMPNGKIQPEFVDTLRKVGNWTRIYGESIYGTRSGPIPPQTWGVSTQKDDKVYIHVLNWSGEYLLLPDWGQKLVRIQSFDSKEELESQKTKFGTLVKLPEAREGKADLVVEIWVK